MEDRETSLLLARRIVAQRLDALRLAGVEQLGRLPPLPAAVVENIPSGVIPVLSAGDAGSVPVPAESGSDNPSHVPLPASLPLMPRTKPAPVPISSAVPGLSLITQPYPTGLPAALAGREQLLAELNGQVRACKLCRDLACTRTQTVFGVGTAKPRVAFFGEAPGADEDRQGEPFVGRAGQLLTKIIAACGWQREDVYILNVLKRRPPDNRNPLPGETANCRQYFERQFEILRPEYIVCVGTIPAQALLETVESVGKLRGRFHRYRDSTVLVTYHPSYLLRNPSAKKYVWDDMQMLLKEMGLPVPGKG